MIKQPCVIDISHWEGRADWNRLGQDPDAITAVICKASEHTSWKDDTFTWNWSHLKSLGIPRGSYHFYRFEYDALKQADNYLSMLDQNGGCGEYPPVLDAEWKDYRDPRTRKWIRSPKGARLTDQFEIFLNRVESVTGRIPMFYSSESYISEYMTDQHGQITLANYERYPLWLAQYPYKPDNFNSPYRLPRGWTKWALWQYAEAGRFYELFPYDGVDLNVPAEWWNPLTGETIPPVDDNPYRLPRDVIVKAYPSLRVRSGAGSEHPVVDRVLPGSIWMVVEIAETDGNLWGRIGEGRWIAIQYYGNVYAEWR